MGGAAFCTDVPCNHVPKTKTKSAARAVCRRPARLTPARRRVIEALKEATARPCLGSSVPTGRSRATRHRLKPMLPKRVDPRATVGAMQQAIGLIVTYHHLFRGVPLQRAAELHRQVRKNAARRRDVALFDVGHGLAALVDGGEEVRPV